MLLAGAMRASRDGLTDSFRAPMGSCDFCRHALIFVTKQQSLRRVIDVHLGKVLSVSSCGHETFPTQLVQQSDVTGDALT